MTGPTEHTPNEAAGGGVLDVDGGTGVVAATRSADRRRVHVVFGGLVLTILLASLDQTIVSSALPTIVGELGGVELMSWVVTAYLLAATVVMPAYGRLGDLIGRKGLFLAAISIFLLGSVICAFAGSVEGLIIGRAVQGLGGGGLLISAQAIVADVIPARERGRYAGVLGGVFAVSSVAGPLLGGYFTDVIGWRWCFWINLPLGVVALVVAAVVLHLPKGSAQGRPRIDVWGIVWSATAVTCVVLLSSWGGHTYALTSLVVWPWPVAAALSFTGSLAGCLITAGVLAALGTGPARQRDGWPRWLERRAARVAHHPVNLFVTTGGLAVWVAQTLAGVAGLAALLAVSPWLGALLVVIPLVLGVGVAAVMRRRGIAKAEGAG